jgi:hypothetical protein
VQDIRELDQGSLQGQGSVNEEIKRLRWAAIAAGNIPEILTTEEAAFVYGEKSPSWLLKSDVPRSYPPGRTGKAGEPIWLYSQLKLHAEKHLTYRLDEPVTVRRMKRAS